MTQLARRPTSATTARARRLATRAHLPVNPHLPGRYGKMTAAEMEAETAKFDIEFIADEARPLTPAEAEQDRRARNKLVGRPPVGQGSAKIRASIERGLLARADAAAKQRGTSRSGLIAEALEALLAKKPRPRGP